MEDEPQGILTFDEDFTVSVEDMAAFTTAWAAVAYRSHCRPARPDPDGWVTRHRYE